MFASTDATAFDEHSDVHEHTQRQRPEQPHPGGARRPALPPPPPPPSAAAFRLAAPRSVWFTPGLIASVLFSVLGVLGLLRLGPAATHPLVTRSQPSAADSERVEATQVSAARDPAVGALKPSAAEGGCVEQAASLAEPADERGASAVGSKAPRRGRHLGRLLVRSNVPAAVYLDGHRVGNTPLRRLGVRPGEHEVALENAVTDQRSRFSFVAQAGALIERRVKLGRREP